MITTKPKLFTRKAVYAIFVTVVFMTLMHPLVVAGFHFPDLGFLVWIHLVPIVIVMHRAGFKRKFVLSWVTATLGHLCMLYWLVIAMKGYGGLSTGLSLVTVVVLCLFLSLYLALPLALACWINRFNKLPLFLLLPVFLILRDVAIGTFPWGGFPWMLPAFTQGQWLGFFQWVDHTGALGLSFYIYLVNGLIADGLIAFFYTKQLDKLVSRLVVVFVLMLFSFFLSFLSARDFDNHVTAKGNVSVGLVQGNISQDMKWDPYNAQSNLHDYMFLSSRAVKDGAEVLLWPETAYPYGLREERLATEKFLDQDEMTIPLIFGAVVYRSEGSGQKQFNGVFGVDTGAHFTDKYYKTHLVPFGEFLPLESVFSKLGSIVGEVGAFTPGDTYHLFAIKGLNFAPLICFEDVFAEYARESTLRGADVLVNFTNDAWYNDSSAQWQHLVFSEFRALENRRPLLRVTNTGYTAVINPKGEVVADLAPFQRNDLVYPLKVEVADSFYTRHGDTWVIYVAIIAGIIFIYTLAKWLMGPVRKVD